MPPTKALAQLIKDFAEVTTAPAPLAPYPLLKLGGAAEALVRPRSSEELTRLQKRALEAELPFRVLGGGGNLLVRDEGVKGVVVLLDTPAFTELFTQGRRVWAGC